MQHFLGFYFLVTAITIIIFINFTKFPQYYKEEEKKNSRKPIIWSIKVRTIRYSSSKMKKKEKKGK